MKQLSEYSAKLDDDIIQTKIRETKYKSKGNYDTKIAIEYIKNFGFWSDIKIMFQTVLAVIKK